VKRTLAALGIARRSYYRWLKEEAWAKGRPGEPVRPISPYEALPEEKQAVVDYARRHPQLRHRELAWRMVDENVAYVSSSTVYRILREAKLVCPWRRRAKRIRTEVEKASRPDQRWATDLMHIPLGDRVYYVINFMDEYSRYLVHQVVLLGMDGLSVSLAAQAAIETLGKDANGKPQALPEVRSDNGSGYISKEFRVVLKENGLEHRRIQPHCPEENGLMERTNRTIREGLEEGEFSNFLELEATLAAIRRRYNEDRLHSALGYLPPWEFYRGNPARRFEERRVKLYQARHRRRETNLNLRQGTLPLERGEAASSN
jgi:putative transposase